MVVQPLGDTVNLSDAEPFYGSTDLDLAAVGAAVEGELDSADATRPGVVIEVKREAGDGGERLEVSMGLGSEANRRNIFILDGAYTEAIVHRTGPGGFSGTWRTSLSYTNYRSEGYFCAIRLPRERS